MTNENNLKTTDFVPGPILLNSSSENELHYEDEDFEYSTLTESPLSSESEDEEPENARLNLSEKLQTWALEHNITHSAIRDLLCILQKTSTGTDLPKDPRSLLHTAKDIQFKSASGGQYFHYGLEKGLKQILYKVKQSFGLTKLVLQINIDGMSFHNSTRTQFWPILAKIVAPFSSEVFTVGIFSGNSKPKNMDFMNEFIDEFKTVVADGLFVEEVCWQIELQCFCADAPAHAFLKGIISHNGYFGCEKCTTKGEHIRNIVSFNQLNATLRTDETFRLKQNPQHHVSQSLLTKFVGMVTQFPYDYIYAFSVFRCSKASPKQLDTWTFSHWFQKA